MRNIKTLLFIFAFLTWTISCFGAEKPRILLFSASWCGQCKLLKTDMEKEKIETTLSVTVKGDKLGVSLELVDVSNDGLWKAAEQKYGKISGVPNISLWRGEKRLLKDRRLDDIPHPTVEYMRRVVATALN
jgi:glutaredoxin